eukprot:6183578-Pleurochrysis_carterae.AAC.2
MHVCLSRCELLSPCVGFLFRRNGPKTSLLSRPLHPHMQSRWQPAMATWSLVMKHSHCSLGSACPQQSLPIGSLPRWDTRVSDYGPCNSLCCPDYGNPLDMAYAISACLDCKACFS